MKIHGLSESGIGYVHMKFESEISNQTEVMLQKPCRLQMDRQGQTTIPPTIFNEQGYNQDHLSGFRIPIIHDICNNPGLILGLRPANERRRYKVTPSLIGWAQAYDQ